MFDKLKNKTVKPSKQKARTSTVEIPRTQAFVEALVSGKLRLSYAALADASEALGEHEASGLSAGQRGSAILRNLPIELQPHICRGNGKYAKGTEWDTEIPADLKDRSFVRPEKVHEFVAAFEKATEEATMENDVPTGLESEDDPSDDDEHIDELDEAQDAALEAEIGVGQDD